MRDPEDYAQISQSRGRPLIATCLNILRDCKTSHNLQEPLFEALILTPSQYHYSPMLGFFTDTANATSDSGHYWCFFSRHGATPVQAMVANIAVNREYPHM